MGTLRGVLSASLVAALVLLAGCGTQTPTSYTNAQSATFQIPPKQLVSDIQRIVAAPPISLPVESVQDGTLVTDWKEYRGELHIVRYWYERTRYHITVIPDWNEPTARSRLEVLDETQQRAETRQKWYPAPELRRPERAAAVLNQIQLQLHPPPAPRR